MPTNDASANNAAAAGVLMVILLIDLVLVLLMVAGMWRVFSKAGQPGWAAIIPIYNVYVLVTVAGKPWWWMLLLMIPYLGFIFFILVNLAISPKFGKGAGYAVGMSFLPFIFYPMLGFSDAQYQAVPALPR